MLELRTRLRRLLRQPAYLLSVLLSLGLGIAVSVAAFSAVDALIFRPLPGIADRDELIRIDWASAATLVTSEEFRAIESQQPRSLALLAAQGMTPLPVALPSGPETLSVAFVSPRVFETLGTSPVIGRFPGAADADGDAPLALISERLWRRAFDGSPAVLRTALTVGGRPFFLAGVTPDRFAGLRIVDSGARDSAYPDVWIRLRDAALWPGTARQKTPWLMVAARLSRGATLRAARSELEVVAARLPESGGSAAALRRNFRVYRGGLDWRDEPAQSLLVLALFLFVPLGVLAIGCVNVINLQLARALDDVNELSLRLALGASRWRLVRLLLLEVAALATLSTALGWAGARVLLSRVGAASPVPLAIDPAAVAFSALLVTAVVCIAGLLPAWWISRDVVAAGLRELRGTSRARVRLRGALVVVQVAASVALLALSGLAIRSLVIRAPDGSAASRETLTADFDFRSDTPDNRAVRFVSAMEERLHDAPSIRGAAFATFSTTPGIVRFARASDPPGQERTAFGGFVTPEWFAVTGARFLGGSDGGGFPQETAVVNRALASLLSDGGPAAAVGVRLRVGRQSPFEVAGVIEDTQVGGDGRPLPMLIRRMPPATPAYITLLVRASDLAGARQSVLAAVTAIDPALPLAQLLTLDERAADASRGMRELVSLSATLGLLSVALAGVGLHSLLAYSLQRRRHEIGVRMALGARADAILRLTLTPVLRLVFAGAVAGLALAVPIAAIFRASLQGVSPLDARGLLPSVAILIAAALAGAAGPTLRALRVQPIDALREE